jgi:hypothetical protein
MVPRAQLFSLLIAYTLRASTLCAQAAPDTPPQQPPSAPYGAVAPPVAGPPATPLEPSEADDPISPLSVHRDAEFGDAGEFAISGIFNASFGHLGYSSSEASSTTLNVQPSLDYFVARNVFIGGSLFVQYTKATTGIAVASEGSSVGAYLRLGGNVPLGKAVSWRPAVSIGAWSQHSTLHAPYGAYASVGGTAVAVGGSSSVDEAVVVGEIFAPFLLHPARHFFLGFGPDLYVDLAHSINDASNLRTFLGASSTIGGWF